jgi:hypothetical protein
MAHTDLTIKGSTVRVHAAVGAPDFVERFVLSADPWDYVTLWLRRAESKKALFYWEQARQFYDATEVLSEIANPLTSYYCCLNASKALLTHRGRSFGEAHGVSGKTLKGKTALVHEEIQFHSSGVFPELARYFGDTVAANETHDLCSMLYNMPFIHRAFTLTFKSSAELFIPLQEPKYVRKEDTSEAWFSACVEQKHVSSNLATVLPAGYEIDEGSAQTCFIRRGSRFTWTNRPMSLKADIARLTTYHFETRRDIVPIMSSPNYWYIKKAICGHLDKSLPALIFAALHRLSELSRYDPVRLSRHLDCQHNWLLSEFLRIAPAQFITLIACEVTGKEFVTPYATATW